VPVPLCHERALASGVFRGTLQELSVDAVVAGSPDGECHTLPVWFEVVGTRTFGGAMTSFAGASAVEVEGSIAMMPTERLEAEATTLAAHIAAATARFLEVVAELERRRSWESWEARSMAHWVSWQCSIGMRAAREHVRVAVALRGLPETRAAFGRGELSFSKVRALTRFATPEQELDDVELARQTTASQLERIAGAFTAACRAVDPDPVRRALDGSFIASAGNADGVTTTITVCVPNDVAARTFTAIDAELERLPHDDAVPARHRKVLAFAAVIDAYCEPDPDRPAVELSVHADVETLAEDRPGRCETAGVGIAPETARRLACDCGVRLTVGHDGSELDLGRRARFPNPSLRRFVLRKSNGCCAFPGCTQRTRLRVHHARSWAHGGPTDRVNLVGLCPSHHRAVHEGGWTVVADGRGGFTFHHPDGRAVPSVVVPAPSDDDAIVDANVLRGIEVTDTTIASLAGGEPMDLDWTMTVVCGNRNVGYRPQSECSAEHSDDDWAVELPPLDAEDQELVARFGDGSG
jgi:hypothetical protein